LTDCIHTFLRPAANRITLLALLWLSVSDFRDGEWH
jgi:hypothetical protein